MNSVSNPSSIPNAKSRSEEPLPPELLGRIAEGASRRDAERELPYNVIADLKAVGFGAYRLSSSPVVGTSLEQVFAATHDLAAADSNVAHIWRNHFMLTEYLAVHRSSNPFRQRLRDEVSAGALGSEQDLFLATR